MNSRHFKLFSFAIGLMIAFSTLQSCKQPTESEKSTTVNVDSLKNIAAQVKSDNDSVSKHLQTFDNLDVDVYSNQKWDRLKESHAKDIKVFWPDGHVTQGLEAHIADLKKQFVFAPDTRIKEHPIKFGSGNRTVVTGVYEGTFTKPMPLGNGKFMQPTGKAFKFPMATVGIWEKGVMVEEHLFWDNQTFAKQVGLE
ncbi:MAG: hypothetical protein JWQ28_2175 [Pedobacter sp.]|jgi:hypothetical protein|nr:hypothetical protein [Pedobacter sp.]